MTIEFVRTLTTHEVCLFLLAGACGGLLRHLLSKGGLILPSKKRQNGETLLRLGFITSMLIGAGMGLLIDHHWLTAFGYGIAGPYTIEKLAQRLANGHLKP